MDNDSTSTALGPRQPHIPISENEKMVTFDSPYTKKSPVTTAMRQPHLPITENEMSNDPTSGNSGKNMLFTLISLLFLACVVGLTLFLYIQNKTASPKNEETATQKGLKTATTKDATTPTPEAEKQMASNLKKYGVVCKRFKSLDEALNSPEIACGLDLSGQNLTSLPNDVTKLTNLNEIDISDNSLKTFPTELLKLPNLYSIDLSNNQITTVPPKVFQDQSLQNINLTGNPVKNPSKSSTGSDSAGLHIEY